MRKLVSMLFALLISSVQLFAQDKTVTGKVTDEKDGAPLAGVSVIVKGTGKGTSTQADGTFSIAVPSNARALVFSIVNYTSMEVTISGRSVVNAALTSEEKTLSEVVVVGFGTVRKKDLTASVGTINASQIRNVPVQSFERFMVAVLPMV